MRCSSAWENVYFIAIRIQGLVSVNIFDNFGQIYPNHTQCLCLFLHLFLSKIFFFIFHSTFTLTLEDLTPICNQKNGAVIGFWVKWSFGPLSGARWCLNISSAHVVTEGLASLVHLLQHLAEKTVCTSNKTINEITIRTNILILRLLVPLSLAIWTCNWSTCVFNFTRIVCPFYIDPIDSGRRMLVMNT